MLETKLSESRWDIVHYIGHGEVNDDKHFYVILNDAWGQSCRVPGEAFADTFNRHPPRLVVLNCCSGAEVARSQSLSAAAPALLRKGIAAVVAMRYRIADESADDFTGHFYRELLTEMSPEAGMVDRAMATARKKLYHGMRDSTVRGFITPVLYLAEHYDRLLLPKAVPKLDEPEILIEGPPPSHELGECLEAIRKRDCVLVLGPGVLRAGAQRDGEGYPSLLDLGRHLAEQCGFEWPAGGSLDEGYAAALLPWVCHHFEYTGRRFRLIQAIRQKYAGCQPPPLFAAIARLQLPGIIYTHFDGLLETSLREIRTPVAIAESLQGLGGMDLSGTLLLCPTGIIRNERTLVLTEEEHEALGEHIANLPAVVRSHLRGAVGRCTLFLGVSPRDTVARRMAARFLETQNRVQGPTYFVAAHPSPADKAYWHKYDVCWLDDSLERVCEALLQEGA